MKIENLIRFTGWSGVVVGTFAILYRDINLFLYWQLIANTSGFIWSIYLQKKLTPDVAISFIVTILAVITKDQFTLYASMWIRSISYQLVFENVVKQRED